MSKNKGEERAKAFSFLFFHLLFHTINSLVLILEKRKIMIILRKKIFAVSEIKLNDLPKGRPLRFKGKEEETETCEDDRDTCFS